MFTPWVPFRTWGFLWVFAAWIWVALMGGCAGKNATLKDKEAAVQRGADYAEIIMDAAKKTGSAYSITVEVDGIVGAGEKLTFFFDTGVTVRAHLFGNAATNPPSPPPS